MGKNFYLDKSWKAALKGSPLPPIDLLKLADILVIRYHEYLRSDLDSLPKRINLLRICRKCLAVTKFLATDLLATEVAIPGSWERAVDLTWLDSEEARSAEQIAFDHLAFAARTLIAISDGFVPDNKQQEVLREFLIDSLTIAKVKSARQRSQEKELLKAQDRDLSTAGPKLQEVTIAEGW